jgi:hypothetical protein
MQVIHYRIAPLDPKAHLFEVRCTIDDPDPPGNASGYRHGFPEVI